MTKNFEIVYRNPAELIPYEMNAKKHDEQQIHDLAAAIKKRGFDQPITVDKHDVIITGHGRREAALLAGLERVPVIVRDDLSEEEVKAKRLEDNRLASIDYDAIKLQQELESLVLGDVEVFGFEERELVDAVKDLGADCIMMRSEHLRAYRALLRTVNIGPSEIMMENFGRPMLCHNGVPFIVNDFIPTDAGKASIYCLHLSEENGVTGLYGGENAGIVVENIGTVQNKDATRTRVKWYCSLANKHDKAIAALTNVKI